MGTGKVVATFDGQLEFDLVSTFALSEKVVLRLTQTFRLRCKALLLCLHLTLEEVDGSLDVAQFDTVGLGVSYTSVGATIEEPLDGLDTAQ